MCIHVAPRAVHGWQRNGVRRGWRWLAPAMVLQRTSGVAMADRELSEGEIRQFREDGVVILRDFVEPAVIAAWRCAPPSPNQRHDPRGV